LARRSRRRRAKLGRLHGCRAASLPMKRTRASSARGRARSHHLARMNASNIVYGLLRRRYGIMPEAIPYRPWPPASKLPKCVILESSAHTCPADASMSPETRCFAWLLASSESARTNQPRYRPQSFSPHRADRSSSPQGPRSCPLFVNPRWTPMTSVCCFPNPAAGIGKRPEGGLEPAVGAATCHPRNR
jgi:hypothetical protein